MVEQQPGRLAGPRHNPALQRVSRRCGSGGDGGTQPLDATAEGGVLDLGDGDRCRVEGAPIPEVCAQHVGPDGEFTHAGARGERGEIFDPLAGAAMSRLNRGRGELGEGVRSRLRLSPSSERNDSRRGACQPVTTKNSLSPASEAVTIVRSRSGKPRTGRSGLMPAPPARRLPRPAAMITQLVGGRSFPATTSWERP
jgi:hypothetical protein